MSNCKVVVHPPHSGMKIVGEIVATPPCTVGAAGALLRVGVENYLNKAVRIDPAAKDARGAILFAGSARWSASIVLNARQPGRPTADHDDVVLSAVSGSPASTSTIEVSLIACEPSGATPRQLPQMYLQVHL